MHSGPGLVSQRLEAEVEFCLGNFSVLLTNTLTSRHQHSFLRLHSSIRLSREDKSIDKSPELVEAARSR